MSVINQNLLLTPEGYQISRSVRLRSSASAYFNRTNGSSPTDAKKWTASFWFKRGVFAYQYLFSATNSGSDDSYIQLSNDQLGIGSYSGAGTNYGVSTNSVLRDSSAWYHAVCVYDSANATSANRAIIYINGVQQTVTNQPDGTFPLNYAGMKLNNASQGTKIGGATYFDGYLTEVNFIDGQALTPSSFGETDVLTGVWKPKKYAGTYGTNGFYLNFSDNSNNTATTIGKDSSGNGNNWTPNNISVTSGVTYDSMTDVPTMGGAGSNHCVLNRLFASQTSVASGATGTAPTISNGNLTVTAAGSSVQTSAIGTFGVTTGKWYCEYIATAVNGTGDLFGFIQTFNGGLTFNGYRSSGSIYNQGATTSAATWTIGDVIGMALDCDAGTLACYKNNTLISTVTITGGVTAPMFPIVWFRNDAGAGSVNFGQRPFAYTPPTGFKALNTQNLPDATIKKGNAYFDVLTWTGDGTSSRAITGLNFQPDLVWDKMRSGAYQHAIVDAVRGGNQVLHSNSTAAEDTNWQYGYVSSFNSNGFTIQAGSTSAENWNLNGSTFAAWNWKESASAGFDIVTYTGTGSNTTVAHNLGVAPKMMIVKQRNSANSWIVYQASLGATQYLRLETTAAAAAATAVWNDTSPTSSVFTVGTSGTTNGSAQTYVAYLFAEVAGYSKFGSYTGNGSTDGPFVYLGFKPRFLMIKATSAAGYNWTIEDTARSTYNASDKLIFPSLSNAENTGTARNDFLSNGFKARDSSNNNVSGVTYIYAAFAENPTKYALAR